MSATALASGDLVADRYRIENEGRQRRLRHRLRGRRHADRRHGRREGPEHRRVQQRCGRRRGVLPEGGHGPGEHPRRRRPPERDEPPRPPRGRGRPDATVVEFVDGYELDDAIEKTGPSTPRRSARSAWVSAARCRSSTRTDRLSRPEAGQRHADRARWPSHAGAHRLQHGHWVRRLGRSGGLRNHDSGPIQTPARSPTPAVRRPARAPGPTSTPSGRFSSSC